MKPACAGPWKSSAIQSVMITRAAFFTKRDVCRWAKAHGFICDKVDKTANWWRIRQKDPAGCDCIRTGPLVRRGTMRLLFCGRV